MFILWKDAYKIGVPEIDEQHCQLIDMLNELYERIGPDVNFDDAWAALSGFDRYAEAHFSCEERIAKENDVPLGMLQLHKLQHEAYRERMRSFRRALEARERTTLVQMMAFLSRWWLSHILVEDMELGRQILAGRQQGTPRG